MKHDFVMTKLRMREDGSVSFSYSMEGYNVLQGDVVIAPEAMATARKQNNYFNGGELYLTEETTVFVSHLVAGELKKGGARMQPEQNEYFFKQQGKGKVVVQVNGKAKKIKGVVGVAENGNRFLIWKDKSMPLILQMDIGWNITLKSIETEC